MYKINEPYTSSKWTKQNVMHKAWITVFTLDAIVILSLIGLILYYGAPHPEWPRKSTSSFLQWMYYPPESRTE